MGTALEDDINHAVQFVLPAEHAPVGIRDVAGGLLPTARVHAVLVAHIHHAILNVILAVQPTLLPWNRAIYSLSRDSASHQ